MKIVIISATVLLCLALLWLYMIKPGKRHGQTDAFCRSIYAHRGLHDSSQHIPENSMASYRRAMMRGYGIELDLHLSADGTLAVIHDTSLLRTAGEAVNITALHDSEIKNYPLEDTDERIPFFSEVVAEVAGRVPLLIELKVDNDDYAEMCEKTLTALKGYTGLYAIQSFDPRVVYYLKKHHPEVMRGQLAGFLRRNGDDLHPFLDFCLRNLLTNFLTKPNFIAYRVQDTDRLAISLCRRLYHPVEFNWTLRKKKHHKIAKKNGAIPIFEDYIP